MVMRTTGSIKDILTVNSKCWNTKEWSVYLHQLGGISSFLVRQHYTTRQRQIAVEPRVPNATTVSLNANLNIAKFFLLGYRPYLLTLQKSLSRWRITAAAVTYPQIGTVNVCRYNG
jgi:hypothetical protein